MTTLREFLTNFDSMYLLSLAEMEFKTDDEFTISWSHYKYDERFKIHIHKDKTFSFENNDKFIYKNYDIKRVKLTKLELCPYFGDKHYRINMMNESNRKKATSYKD